LNLRAISHEKSAAFRGSGDEPPKRIVATKLPAVNSMELDAPTAGVTTP
jgi:hypothetical protein